MKHPPYHLRTNKAVDRLLLVDALRGLELKNEQCTYYSLAGPFLEDLRVMDHFFPGMRLVSLESDEETFKRQQFHQFDSRIELRNAKLRDFLTNDYKPGIRDIFWLDYTDLKYRHFEEFQIVLNAVPPGSVIRITLRAEPQHDLESIEEYLSTEQIDQLRKKINTKFENQFRKVLSRPSSGPFASRSDYALMVQKMIRRAASNALDVPGSTRDFLHVHSTRYSDQNQMLSVTGIVCQRDQMEATRIRLKGVRFVDFDWARLFEINIPALSVKECLHLERYLPVSPEQDAGEELHKVLKYAIDRNEPISKQQLAHYANYHREYPRFVRSSI